MTAGRRRCGTFARLLRHRETQRMLSEVAAAHETSLKQAEEK